MTPPSCRNYHPRRRVSPSIRRMWLCYATVQLSSCERCAHTIVLAKQFTHCKTVPYSSHERRESNRFDLLSVHSLGTLHLNLRVHSRNYTRTRPTSRYTEWIVSNRLLEARLYVIFPTSELHFWPFIIMADASIGREPDRVDLHELAKGWKAAIARASDPSTR